MKIFGQRLKQLREEKGMSLRELADICSMSKSAISMYEQGKRQPKYETLEIFAHTFNTDIAYLLGKTSTRIRVHGNLIESPDDENPWILKICEIMESTDVDTQIAICNQAEIIAQGKSPEKLTSQEDTLLRLFRETSEEGRMRMIQSVLNIHDAVQKSSDSAGTASMA